MIALKPGMRRVRNLSSARPVRRGDCACAQFCCRGIGNGDSSHRRLRLSKFSPPGPFFIRACALISKRAWRWCTSERKRGSEIDQGTRITILLPRADELQTASHEADVSQNRLAQSDKTILIVEDEPDIRQIAAEAMRELGYTVLEAADGEQALELIQADATIALVFSDIELGGNLDGYGLANKARAMRPSLPVVFCSGNTSGEDPSPGDATGRAPMFRKPYKFEDLGQCICEALETAAKADSAE